MFRYNYFKSSGIFVTVDILGSAGGEYEDGCLLGCSAVQSGRNLPTFQMCLLPPQSGIAPMIKAALLPSLYSYPYLYSSIFSIFFNV
jgi:hypothetical protein